MNDTPGTRFAPLRTEEVLMEIQWQRDIEAAQREASQTGKPLLLDFTAAPL